MWINDFMKDEKYSIHDCGGGGDCFFMVLSHVFPGYSSDHLRAILSDEVTDELFNTYYTLYNDYLSSIENDKGKIEELLTENSLKLKSLQKENDELQKLFQQKKKGGRKGVHDIVLKGKKIREEYTKLYTKTAKEKEQHERDISNTMELLEEYSFMDDVEDIDDFKEAVKKSSFYAETWSISTLERLLNVKVIILSKENYENGNRSNVLLCGQINDKEMDNKEFVPDYYVIAEHSAIPHYRLITYEDQEKFKYEELPPAIKELIVNNCLKGDGGPYANIPDFKQNNAVFQFYSKSALAPPGKGRGETGSPEDFPDLKGHWRKALSNFYADPAGLFEMDDSTFASGEHGYHYGKFIEENPEFAKKFTLESNSEFSKDPKMAKAAGGETGVYRYKKDGSTKTVILRKKTITMDHGFDSAMHMKRVLEAKFTGNKAMRDILLGTKNARLVHYVTRGENEVWNDLMDIRSKLKK